MQLSLSYWLQVLQHCFMDLANWVSQWGVMHLVLLAISIKELGLELLPLLKPRPATKRRSKRQEQQQLLAFALVLPSALYCWSGLGWTSQSRRHNCSMPCYTLGCC
jgi:hypothetical protein